MFIPPSEYRDYGRDRHKLLLRIINRINRCCHVTGKDRLEEMQKYILQWFVHDTSKLNESSFQAKGEISTHDHGVATTSEKEILQRLSFSSTSTSSSFSLSEGSEHETEFSFDTDEINEYDDLSCTATAFKQLGKADMSEFLSWAFFGKFVPDLQEWEQMELEKCYELLEQHGIAFNNLGRSKNYRIRDLISLQDCVAMHRPLFFYAGVEFTKWCASILLRMNGFYRRVSPTTGVVCWHKKPGHGISSSSGSNDRKLLPLLFFHGIGPGGHVSYSLMIMFWLARTGREVFLFENHSVSCTLNFDAISEKDTVNGIIELLDHHCQHQRRGLSLVGHSFGSSTLTWLLHSPLRHRIRQLVIMEPSSLMLSEADIMMNFSKPLLKMCMDLGLEHYVRRHYAWYNSELWLEDVPDKCYVIIALAGKDQVVSSKKIKQEITCYVSENQEKAKKLDFIYWKNNLHAICLALPWCWRELNAKMLQQELLMSQ